MSGDKVEVQAEEHYTEYAWHRIKNPHMKDVKDYLWPGHRLTAEQVHVLAAAVTETSDPVTMSQAFASDEGKKWRKAADEEYAALMKNQTWNLTSSHPDVRLSQINGCSKESTYLMAPYPDTKLD